MFLNDLSPEPKDMLRIDEMDFLANNPYLDYYPFILNNLSSMLDDVPIPKKMRGLKTEPVRNSKENPKIGRNEPCPCNSGKKYKNCCLKL